MKKIRISIVQYLNTAPLIWGFTQGLLQDKYELSFTIPSQCADDLRDGRADVAIIPAIEFQRIEDLVVLPALAIASKKQVRSLLIVSRKPITEVGSIALDVSSRSTQALTRILCSEHWNISPRFFEAAPDVSRMLDDADAALLIGDPALRLAMAMAENAETGSAGEWVCDAKRIGGKGGTQLHVYDVVQHWRDLTGLPAVLAVWAARRETVTQEILADFTASKEYGMARIEEISADAADKMSLPQAELTSYLRDNIDFTLDSENISGLEMYYCLAAKLGLTPRAKAIEWAAVADADVIRVY